MRKPSLLALAIEAPAPKIVPVSTEKVETPPAPTRYVSPSRARKSARTHHLPPAYWKTLEELSFKTRDDSGKRVPQERLVAEALNLLFGKYNFPLVRDD